MNSWPGILAAVSLLMTAACGPAKQPMPDPIREEVIVLQKQLLELQNLQNETRARLEESSAAVAALSARLQALEEKQAAKATAVAPAPVNPGRTPAPAVVKAADKKKTAKKPRKKVRRQE